MAVLSDTEISNKKLAAGFTGIFLGVWEYISLCLGIQLRA